MEINIKIYDVKSAPFPNYNWEVVPSEFGVALQYIEDGEVKSEVDMPSFILEDIVKAIKIVAENTEYL